jgi:hypothetical protein
MSAIPYDSPEQHWESPEQEPFVPPGRPRRRFLNRKSAALAALLTCAAGFYAGIRVEKSQVGGTASAATASVPGAAGGFAGRFGGGASGNASFGTISSVNGNTIYLTTTTGNTVKVTLSPSATLTKSLSVSKGSLHPGDSVLVQGVKNSGGTIVATSASDQGARTTGSGSTSSGASSSSAGGG